MNKFLTGVAFALSIMLCLPAAALAVDPITMLNGVERRTSTVPTVEVQPYSIAIAWDDNDNAAGMRPSELNLPISMNGAAASNAITVSNEDEWTAAFDGWETIDESGSPVEYGIELGDGTCLKAFGYTGKVDGNLEDGFVVTLSFDPKFVDWKTIIQGSPESESDQAAMPYGWLNRNGTRYYIGESGRLLTGWQKIDGSWYYLYGSTGVMAKSLWIGDDHVGADGKWDMSR